MNDEMTEKDVITLMVSSKNSDEWNKNYDLCCKKCRDLHKFWWPKVMQSGLASRIMNGWIQTGMKNLLNNQPENVIEILPPPEPANSIVNDILRGVR